MYYDLICTQYIIIFGFENIVSKVLNHQQLLSTFFIAGGFPNQIRWSLIIFSQLQVMRCCSMTSNHLMFVKVVFVGPVGSRSVIRLWKMFWWQSFIISLQLEFLGPFFFLVPWKTDICGHYLIFVCSTRWRESYDFCSFIWFFRINFPAAGLAGFP